MTEFRDLLEEEMKDPQLRAEVERLEPEAQLARARMSASKDSGRALATFHALRASAKANGIQDMPLDEINREIRDCRAGIGE